MMVCERFSYYFGKSQEIDDTGRRVIDIEAGGVR
jgi:hypothetical protein